MRHLFATFILSLCLLLIQALWADDISSASCTYNGIPLYGEVEVVEYFGDITVEVVDSFPDLYVEVVDMFADDCGEWEFVESFGDFTVEFVEYFGDITIEYVDAFPGVADSDGYGDGYDDEGYDDGTTTTTYDDSTSNPFGCALKPDNSLSLDNLPVLVGLMFLGLACLRCAQSTKR